MTTRRTLFLVSLLALALSVLSACAVRREVLGAPQILLQSLNVERGTAQLRLVVTNVSNVAMRFDELNYQLLLSGVSAGSGVLDLDLEVPPNSTEALNTRLPLSPEALRALSQPQTLEYTLKGMIRSSKPSVRFEFLYQGRLSPTPGKAGTWR